MKKRIGFNLLPYNPEGQGGAEVYFRSIIKAAGKLDTENEYVLIGKKDCVHAYLPPDRPNFRAVAVDPRLVNNRIGRVFGEQVILPLMAPRLKLDVLVSNYVMPLYYPGAQAVIIHDALFRRLPEVFEPSKLAYWKYFIPQSIKRSKYFLTVSHFSKNEFRELVPEAREKEVHVTAEGIRESLQQAKPGDEAHLAKMGIRKPYIVCVATFGKHKNILGLVHAFGLLAKENPDLQLVLIGQPRHSDALAYYAEIKTAIEGYGLEDRVVTTGHVTDEDLATLYAHARASVQPSLYEGFGLPVIEAQYFGCPVACSNMASLPEVAGDGAVLFDPHSAESMANAVKPLLHDESLRQKLQAAGHANRQRYTWEQAAKDLLGVILP